MNSSFRVLIVNHPSYGPVAITVNGGTKFIIHLPHKHEEFAPFGTERKVVGKILPKLHSFWQEKNPKAGQVIRFKNNLSGETAQYKVLFVGKDLSIGNSRTAKTIMSRYAKELAEISRFTSNHEIAGYSRVINAFFKTAIDHGYHENYNFISSEYFYKILYASVTYFDDLNDVSLVFVNHSSHTVHLDQAMWYLIIYKLNLLHHLNQPFPNIK